MVMVLFLSIPAFANPMVFSVMPNAELVGKGRLTYLFWSLYDLSLYAPQGKWQKDQPQLLEFSYLRQVEGKMITERTISEIKRQGFTNEKKLADWTNSLNNIFPDVEAGSRFIIHYSPPSTTRFYDNTQEIGRIDDPEFGTVFFAIWLSEKTRASELRKKLLGN